MNAVLTFAPGSNVRDIRQALLNAGLECSADDCVGWNQLALRLAEDDADLVVVTADATTAVDWPALKEGISLTLAPIMVIGSMQNSQEIISAQVAGARAYVDTANLPGELDEALDRLATSGSVQRRRGMVTSVFAPTAGSGGTTVAANLAGHGKKS